MTASRAALDLSGADEASPTTIPLVLSLTMNHERSDLEDAENWAEHLACSWALWRAQATDLATALDELPDVLDHGFLPVMQRRLTDRVAMCEREAAKTLIAWRGAARAVLVMQSEVLTRHVQTASGLQVASWFERLGELQDDLRTLDVRHPELASV